MTRCGHCGVENTSSAVFCHSCNRFLAWDSSARVVEPVTRTIAVLDETAKLAAERGRDDLEQRLQATRERLAAQPIPVVVAGEFKRGKSTLINALLQRAVCPVDPDLVTAVPLTVRWAEKPQLTVYGRSDDGELIGRPAPMEELDLLVRERADATDPDQERFVEVGLPHRMLHSGMRLVDTPGVGGLDSAHGYLTLGALQQASGVVFVTDAAQELTGPELEFLATAVERCPQAAVVVTKTDLYRQWRRIADLDRDHLERAGLQLPVITVSSFLRLRSARNPKLVEESGFLDLVRFLATDVVAASRAASAREAAGELDYVADHLTVESGAELVVLTDPAEAPRTVDQLKQAKEVAGRLVIGAGWQQVLGDGIADLVADIEHDLTRRLRTIVSAAEETIQANDPRRVWAETEVWLRRQVAIAAVANRDLLTERAQRLAAEVAEEFDLQTGEIDLGPQGDDAALDRIPLPSVDSLKLPGSKLASWMSAARSSFYMPMTLGTLAASTFEAGPVVHLTIAGVSAALGAGIGRKLIVDERHRQVIYRRQLAQNAIRKFVEEVAFVLNKQTRDRLRATQRQLRDDFAARAVLMQRSAAEALERAYRAEALQPQQRQLRTRELTEQQQRVDTVRRQVRELVAKDD